MDKCSYMQGFQPLTFNESNAVLQNASKLFFPKTKKLVMVIGAKGSGKSTLIANLYLNKKLNLPYINADLMQREIFSNIVDKDERNKKTLYYTMNIISNNIMQGNSFCYESVFAQPSKLEIVKKAKEQGYKIYVFYLSTASPNINIDRVAKRVIEGGHNVPTSSILDGYYNSINNSKKVIAYCDKFYYLDNSKELENNKKIINMEKEA